MRSLYALLLLSFAAPGLHAQSISLFGHTMNLPPDAPNVRFVEDGLSSKRPALTHNGFSCTATSSCDMGYGWVEVMSAISSSSARVRDRLLYRSIADYATQYHGLSCAVMIEYPSYCVSAQHTTYFADPVYFGGRTALDRNSKRLQTLAFFTLTTFLLGQNGVSETTLNNFHTQIGAQTLPYDHATMRNLLVSTLRGISGNRSFDMTPWAIDADKQRIFVANLARAVDLYLALENAYLYYYGSEAAAAPYLLTASEKADLMSYLIRQINYMRQKAVNPPGANPVNRLATEPGNFATLVRATLGYASLAYQRPLSRTNYESLDGYSALDHLSAAIDATFTASNGDPSKNYAYTSGDGLPLWAEGPYYLQYAVAPVMQFWHALRTTRLGTRPNPAFAFPAPLDAFKEDRLMAPLEWLGDLTTPQGETPPFDDGNRHKMNAAHLLAWSSDYGKASVGQKFAWIDAQKFDALDDNWALLSLSIPKATPSITPFYQEVWGYGSGSPNVQTDQIVVRKTVNGAQHYLAFNAEGLRSEASIRRGHGHEQPDNLNFVYYVDGTSAVMDQGYNDGGGISGSDWNNYDYQNVLWRDGPRACLGLPVPYKFTPAPSQSYHWPAAELVTTQHTNLQQIHARQLLNGVLPVGTQNGSYPVECEEYQSTTTRDVLVVGNFEYLLDINANQSVYPGNSYVLHYTFDADSLSLPAQTPSGLSGFVRTGRLFDFNGASRQRGSKQLSLYAMPVEQAFWRSDGSATVEAKQVSVRERFGDNYTASEVNLREQATGASSTVASVIKVGLSVPAYTPKTLWAYGGTSRAYQALAWQQNATDFDLLIVRSAGDTGTAEVKANPAIAGTAYPNLWLALPAGQRFGFARVRSGSGGIGTLVSGYTLALTTTTAPGLAVTVTGPGTAIAGQAATSYGNASGGTPAYYYTFETKPASCSGGGEMAATGGKPGSGGVLDAAPACDWSYAGGGWDPYVSLTRTESYYVRVSVQDRNGVYVTSYEEYVGVSGSGGSAQVNAAAGLTLEQAPPTVLTLGAPMPNPTANGTTLRVGLPQAAAVEVTLYDVLGREAARVPMGDLGAGWHRLPLDVSDLAPGAYVVRLVANGATQTTRLVVQH